MPAKSKECHRFSVGDSAIVINTETNKQVNKGTITKVTPSYVTFTGPSNAGRDAEFLFQRKGTRWIQKKSYGGEKELKPFV